MTSTVFGQKETSGFAEALVYGADNGAHISTNSWGYTPAGAFDQSVLDAIDYATNAGVLVVFAAGNFASDEDWYPGKNISQSPPPPPHADPSTGVCTLQKL